MVKTTSVVAAAVLALSSPSMAFVSSPAGKSTTALEMKQDVGKTIGASAIAGAMILSNVLTAGTAVAMDNDFGTDQLLAARSGGRAGGRSSASYSRPAPAPTRTVQRTTVIAQPAPVISAPVVVSPFGYGYNPMGGFGLGYGLGAVNSIGNEIRDQRQESEIQRERYELEMAKQKSADLEARLRDLERAQQK